MTHSRRYGFALLVSSALLLPGCLDIGVDTAVNTDGSVDRAVTMTRETRTVPDEAFPPTSDSGWRTEWMPTPGGKASFDYTARKHFASAEELMREYNGRPAVGPMSAHVELERRFAWFYTYVDYREVYKKDHRPFLVPMSRYLSDAEMHRYLRGDESDSLTAKVKEWENREDFEEGFALLIQQADQLNAPDLPPSLFTVHKEEIYRAFRKEEGVKDTTRGKKNDVADQLTAIAAIVGTRSVMKMERGLDSAFAKEMEESDRRYKSPDSWNCTVHMPGLLLEADGTTVEGSAVTWKFKSGQLKFGDYEMHAVSRVTNVWAFVVTGLLLLTVVGVGFAKSRRGKIALPQG